MIAGDGCLMEGINHEAIGLAGHLGLGRMIVLWDDNRITIDGSTELSTSEDIPARFAAAGWHVQHCNGHETPDIERSIDAALADPRPSLIACKTIIGKGAPNLQGTHKTHGSPLGKDEVAAARDELGWTAPPFEVPENILSDWRETGKRGAKVRAEWQDRLASHSEGDEFSRRMDGVLPQDFSLDDYIAESSRRAQDRCHPQGQRDGS